MTQLNQREKINFIDFRNNMPPLNIELYEELVRDYSKQFKSLI